MVLAYSVNWLERNIVLFCCRKCKQVGYNLIFFGHLEEDAINRVSTRQNGF